MKNKRIPSEEGGKRESYGELVVGVGDYVKNMFYKCMKFPKQ